MTRVDVRKTYKLYIGGAFPRSESGHSYVVDDAKGRFVTGDAVGFVADEIVAWGGAGSTLSKTMARLAEGAEILTVVSGEGAPIPLGDLEGHAPGGVELELHDGGQPHYWWLLAAQ